MRQEDIGFWIESICIVIVSFLIVGMIPVAAFFTS